MGEKTGAVMDFPTAWKFVADTQLGEHEEKCSYRETERALLCDCRVLWDEYERRKAKRCAKGGGE